MGKMVVDLHAAIDASANLDFVDSTKIFVVGYSLGATVGLYAAALDKRIAGVVSVCGFTPMRLDTPDKGIEGIKAYSHLHGLLPRLGFFVGNEARIPYNFDEILASIAPRSLLVIAPKLDKDATFKDVQNCITKTKKFINCIISHTTLSHTTFKFFHLMIIIDFLMKCEKKFMNGQTRG